MINPPNLGINAPGQATGHPWGVLNPAIIVLVEHAACAALTAACL